MKKYTKENILKQYEESGELIYNALSTGDYRKGNRENYVKFLWNFKKILI